MVVLGAKPEVSPRDPNDRTQPTPQVSSGSCMQATVCVFWRTHTHTHKEAHDIHIKACFLIFLL